MNANKQRGEVLIKGPDDKDFKLKLTLGAIAQIEEEIEGIESLADIGDAMTKMKDLLAIFIALLHGGGHKEITREDMMDWDVDIKTLSKSIMEAFQAAGFKDDDEEVEGESQGH